MNLPRDQEYELRLLLKHLEKTDEESKVYQDWQMMSLSGGANNRLFRATSSLGDFVIKFTIRDERNRAECEFQALSALREAGVQIAPLPILVDNDTYRQPVVVQTWIEGNRIDHPAETDEEWEELLQYYHVVHSVTPDTTSLELPMASSASSIAEGRALVHQQLAGIPSEARPTALKSLVRRFERASFPEWERAPVTLCRIDPNISNFIRCKTGLASVDWEYSGWGDPAFDIADLMTHPTYMDVPSSRWAWVIPVYRSMAEDSTAAIRIEAYYKTLLVWWVARSARYLYEIPRGLDSRLASRSPSWEAKAEMQYDHYLGLAEAVLDAE